MFQTSFKDISIRSKLLTLILLVLLFGLAFGIYVLVIFNKMNTFSERIIAQEKILKKTMQLQSSSNLARYSLRTYVLSRDPRLEDAYYKTIDDVNVLLDDLSTQLTDEADQRVLQEFIASRTQINEIEMQQVNELKATNRKPLDLLDARYNTLVRGAFNSMNQLVQNEELNMSALLEENNSYRNQATGILATHIVALFLLVAGLGTYIILVVNRSVQNLTDAAVEFSNGNFSKRAIAYSRDEIGSLALIFNQMADKLAEIYSGLVDEKNKLGKKTKTLKSANEQIGAGWLQIQREKNRLLASLDSLPFGLVITDETGTLHIKNTEIDRLFKGGLMSLSEIQAQVPTVNFTELVTQCMTTKKATSIQAVLDSSKLTIFASPIIPKGEAAVGVVIIFYTDTTSA